MVKLCLQCDVEIPRKGDYTQKRFCSRKCWHRWRSLHTISKDATFADLQYHVYALSVDEHTFRYVGATNYINPDKKRVQYVAQRLQHTTPVFTWVRDVYINLKLTVIETVDPGDVDRVRERFWITELRALGFDLLNQQTGGERGFTQPSWNKGMKTGPRDAETKAKISATLTGRKGVPRTPEWRAKIGDANRGKKHSEETRRKLSEAHMGHIPWNKGLKTKSREEPAS